MPKKSKKSPNLSLLELPTERTMQRLFPTAVVKKAKDVARGRDKSGSHKSSLAEG